MSKKNNLSKYGVSFSLNRLLGITKAKRNLSRKTGIPTTKQGIQRKVGSLVLKGLATMIFGGNDGKKNNKE